MKEEKLKQLLDRYYDGNTSPEEERELKEYFSDTDIFPGYEAEKEIFCHYANTEKIAVSSIGFESRILNAVDGLEANRRLRITRKRYITFLSAAATILILVGSLFIFIHDSEPDDSFSDPRIAYAETMKILNDVSVKLNRGKMALQPIGRLNTAALDGIRSLDRSVSVMEDGLRRIGLDGVE
jgi:hypothetical protein